MFPLGCTDYLSYPNKMSVVFTDSIPCFAVLFKILSPVLPDEFQYFGLWGMLCFVLQGILSVRIVRNFTYSGVYAVLAGWCILDFLQYKRIKRSILVFSVYVAACATTAWILGAFFSRVGARGRRAGRIQHEPECAMEPSGLVMPV